MKLTCVAAAIDYENDGDFQFSRQPKKAKTQESQSQPVRRSPRGKQQQQQQQQQEQYPIYDEPPLVVRKNASRKSTKASRDDGHDYDNNKGASRTSASQSRKTDQEATALAGRGNRFESPEPSTHSAMIALPMSDTPINQRNKEFRKNGSSSGRRSSLGSRGRRASQLQESGQSAIPHREVDPGHFYKHISAEGLPETRRMQQLLTWCGERALPEKPRHGTVNASAILGGKWLTVG